MKTFTVVALALLQAVTANQAIACDFPPKALLQKPRLEYRGRYANEAYHYSVRIPDMLTGYDQPTPPHHGFGVVIGESSQSYIEVNGEANSLEYDKPRDAALRLVEHLRQRGKKIESETLTQSRLGRLDAAVLVVTYSCPGSAERYVQASSVALSPDKSTLYEVTLYAPASRYDQDRPVFERIRKSWKYANAIVTSPRG